MKDSKIEWTDHTFNPWIGCTKVSEACKFCYAEMQEAIRYKRVEWGPGQPRRRTSDNNWRQPTRWNREAAEEGRRYRVFCASLADIFDAEVPQEWRADLFEVIRETEHLDWLLLSKRPENILSMVPEDWGDGWPNVWLGSTAENQQRADERLPILLAVPAVVRFASCEPLLGPLDLSAYLGKGLDWVIAGGETGRAARPMKPEWARALRDQCVAQRVAFHFKQWGDYNADGLRVGRKKAGRKLDGRCWDGLPKPHLSAVGVVERTAEARPLTSAQRKKILGLLGRGRGTAEIATDLGVPVGQVRAIKAHRTMGTYD